MSHCFISSREKIIKRLGLYFFNFSLTKAWPKDPVPPVTNIDKFLKFSYVT
jgi:hypothetical protein